MAWTLADAQAKRDELMAALGRASVTYGDRSIVYSDLSKALARLDSEIERLSSIVSSSDRCTYVTHSRE